VRWAAKIPAVHEGAVEVRPVPDYSATGEEQPEGERANA
jgi:hypothetical protein